MFSTGYVFFRCVSKVCMCQAGILQPQRIFQCNVHSLKPLSIFEEDFNILNLVGTSTRFSHSLPKASNYKCVKILKDRYLKKNKPKD